jgi:hypothetical protein
MTHKKTTVEIPQWWEATADNYNDFWNMQRAYSLAGLNTSYKEIAQYNTSPYLAIFWVGKRPDQVIEKYSEKSV